MQRRSGTEGVGQTVAGIAGTELASELTKRQREVLERLELGMSAKRIATDIGVSRNAVYQTIDRLRRQGAVPETYTPSGQPPRRPAEQLSAAPAVAIAPRASRLAELRSLSPADASYPALIEAAGATGDVAALAYELGRAEGEGRDDLSRGLVESALRRLGVLREPERGPTGTDS
jgi:DNA-binding CsgD family transcriptional regulator